jgi:SAM-dependent methyltransferase
MGKMHKQIRKLKKIRRNIYGFRTFIPWLREKHRLEAMVGPLGYWDKLQSYQLNVLRFNGLNPHHKLLDIGCGPLQGGIAFIRFLEKGNYYGIDKNQNSLEAGKKQIIKKRLSVKEPFLSVSDTFGEEELNGAKFDFMWASQILYYFNDEMIKSLMRTISFRLNDKGKFLGDIIGPKHYEFKTKEHGWILHTVDSLNAIAEEFKLKVKGLGEIEQFGYPGRLALKTNILIEITK